METSIFMDKERRPTEVDLITTLEGTHKIWTSLRDFVLEKYPAAVEEWNYPGKKYGWSFRIKDKKRAIIYLLPLKGYFKAAFVFGQKATDKIMASGVSEEVKAELQNARVYAEGRGIRVDVNDEGKIADIKKLIEIKLAN